MDGELNVKSARDDSDSLKVCSRRSHVHTPYCRLGVGNLLAEWPRFLEVFSQLSQRGILSVLPLPTGQAQPRTACPGSCQLSYSAVPLCAS